MELWQYSGDRGYGIPSSLYVMFYQKNGFGPYLLYSPLNDGIRNLFVQRAEVTSKTDEDRSLHVSARAPSFRSWDFRSRGSPHGV